jgi:hypothetical protein
LLGETKLSGHRESFQLERSGSGVFVNVPTASQIAVVRRPSMKVLGQVAGCWCHIKLPNGARPSGARTALFVPEQSRLYLAGPHRGNQKAEIRIYEAR